MKLPPREVACFLLAFFFGRAVSSHNQAAIQFSGFMSTNFDFSQKQIAHIEAERIWSFFIQRASQLDTAIAVTVSVRSPFPLPFAPAAPPLPPQTEQCVAYVVY